MTIQFLRGQKFVCRVSAALIASSMFLAVGLRAQDCDRRGGDSDRDDHNFHFTQGNLVVSRSVYDDSAVNITAGTTQLPPGCTTGNCVTAIADGIYPYVFNNNTVDGSFGVTSKILLDEVSPNDGHVVGSLQVPNSLQEGAEGKDQMVTSFSSKSEIALNLSTDRRHLTFMGYVSPIGAVDVSNSNTPGVIDPTNPVPEAVFRAVAVMDDDGHFHFTETNAYSGNNGRAAILNDTADVLYLAGNAGNGSNPQPPGVIEGAGAQFLVPSYLPEAVQTPPNPPTPLGSFNITQLGDKADKIGKDTNFRGLTVFNNVVYYDKGSGGNGVNTVYFVDTTGKACPTGSGLPAAGAALPTSPLAYSLTPTQVQTNGLPSNMCVLSGFPTSLAKNDTNFFPFGLWFANSHTLYVAQEGDGTNTFSTVSGTYTDAAAQTTAGIQKWVLNDAAGAWQLAYTLSSGLDLGVPYTISGYPSGTNAANKNLPWSPSTDGVRNITGRVNRDGTVTIYGITSTVSGSGDQGADPNKLVAITDTLTATSAGSEAFTTLRTAKFGEVLRGVSFAPGTDRDYDWR